MFVTVKRFLADSKSLGPGENDSPDSEFFSYTQADLDIKFILSLIRSDESLKNTVCVPDFLICLHDPFRIEFLPKHDKCTGVLPVRAGVIVTGVKTKRPRLWLPEDFHKHLSKCTQRFVVFNCGLYPHNSNFENGHANALIMDTRHKIIERFDPAGRCNTCSDINILFEHAFPSWKVVQFQEDGIVGGIQQNSDSYSGMCVTFSLYYTLLRLLNPNKSYKQIIGFMMSIDHEIMRQQILRLNKFAINVLKQYERHELLRTRKGTWVLPDL